MNSSYAIKVETLYIGVSFFVKYFECCQKLSNLGCNFAAQIEFFLNYESLCIDDDLSDRSGRPSE